MIRRYAVGGGKSRATRWVPSNRLFFFASALSALLLGASLTRSYASSDGVGGDVRAIVKPTASVVNIEYPIEQNGKKWIRSKTELRGIFPISLEAYRSVLSDYTSYPGFLSRIASVQVIEENKVGPVIREIYDVSIFGFHFPSTFVLQFEYDNSQLPLRWIMRWSFVDSDGSIGGSNGFWELSDVSEAGQRRVSVRHVNLGLVRKDFPIQERVMRMIAERELGASLTAIYREALRRRRLSNPSE